MDRTDERRKQEFNLYWGRARDMRSAVLVSVCVATLSLVACERNPGCSEEGVRTNLVDLASHFSRWSDAMKLAGATPRIGLAGPIEGLQRLKSELPKEVEACLVPAVDLERQAESEEIDAFLTFMSDASLGDLLARPHFGKALELRGKAETSIREIRRRYWPNAVRQEEEAAAAVNRRKKVASELAARERKRQQDMAFEAASKASAADLQRRLSEIAQEDAARAAKTEVEQQQAAIRRQKAAARETAKKDPGKA